jgi:dihydroflavonol-4-reductase
MQHPSALVTGANGFLGSRLVRHLVERGEHVKAFVRAGSNLDALRGLPEDQVTIAVGDIQSSHTVYRALIGCNRIYHVASNYSFWDRKPERIMNPAVVGTGAVLEAAAQRNIKKVVVTSSAATLGSTEAPAPMDETHAFNLSDAETYVLAKRAAEQVALERAQQGQPVVVVNPASIFGPGDWKPTPTGAMLVRYLNWPPSRRLPLPPSGGLSVVDVDDVVVGHRLAMEHGRIGERYILGGENLELSDLFQRVLPDVTGFAPILSSVGAGTLNFVARVLEAKARLGGGDPPLLTSKLVKNHVLRYVWVSSQKAAKDLGYKYRPATETLTRAVRWYIANGYVQESAAARSSRAA